MTVRAPLVGIIVGVAALVAATCVKPPMRIVYNPSDSVPRGWYFVFPATRLGVGQYVIAQLPSDTAMLAAKREYLPRSVPILKEIAAVAGQRVCVRDAVVYIDGRAVARTLSVDRMNRPLTAWVQCRPLVKGELFLLNPGHLASFDSRYFGPLDASFVRGRAIPLWTVESQ